MSAASIASAPAPGGVGPAAPGGDLARCLDVVLGLCGWNGARRDLIRSLPHEEKRLDLAGIRNALAILGYPTQEARRRGGRVDRRRLPALLMPRRGGASVLYLGEGGALLRYDGADGKVRVVRDGRVEGRVYVLVAPEAPRRGESWMAGVLRRFVPEIPPLIAASALIALLGLAGPLFVMSVFNLVAGARDAAVLPALALGAALALAAETWLRGLRRRILAHVGERLDWLVTTSVFSQLMTLPTALVEGAGRAAQVSRIRDFTGIKEFITGPFAVAALDLPATLLSLALLVILGGWIALAPVAAGISLGILYLATRGPIQRSVAAAAAAGQARDALALEAIEAQRTLKLGGAVDRYAARCAEAAAEAAVASARASVLSGTVMLVAQALMTLAALTAATAGVLGVLTGRMDAGSLIAGMMLVWRVLGPLQSGFMMLSRWRQTGASIRQVDAMMSLETERPPLGTVRLAPPAGGALEFHKVMLRFPARAEPLYAGVSFSVAPGELVAVTGAHGSGKSTLLRLASGLIAPQAGSVRLDGLDARAYDAGTLRRAMAWVPQSPNLIYGTVAQNLRLARPDADDAALRAALDAALALDAVEAMPEGINTRISDNGAGELPRSLLVRLTLARALIAEAPFLLMDEAVAGLDDDVAEAFVEVTTKLRGRRTILMVSHRPSHIRLADRVLSIEDGQVVPRAPAPAGRAPQRMSVFREAAS